MYSASHVESAVMLCFMDLQQMGVPLYRCTMPDMDLRSVTSAVWSASEYEGGVGDGFVRAGAAIEGDAVFREEEPVLGGLSKVPEDVFEGVPVPLGRSVGGYRQAVDNEIYIRSG